MWETWNDVFRNILGPAERGFVGELRGHRNRWAHQEPFSSDDAYRALDTAHRLLTAVSAEQARDVERLKMELLNVRFEEQAQDERRRQVGATIPVRGRQSRFAARAGPSRRSGVPLSDPGMHESLPRNARRMGCSCSLLAHAPGLAPRRHRRRGTQEAFQKPVSPLVTIPSSQRQARQAHFATAWVTDLKANGVDAAPWICVAIRTWEPRCRTVSYPRRRSDACSVAPLTLRGNFMPREPRPARSATGLFLEAAP